MAKGNVKFFDVKKGFGFIKPETGNNDVFVHISALQAAGLASLADNQAVEFEISEEGGRKSAKNLKLAA
ncbi:MAG: cold-shock protein [Rickettsiales bacterium]|jgi:CspA family cold shock protein|nr:cold-shock protein [Rickettsiales bacterium]